MNKPCNIRRIAVFRALQLGDLIQAVPALRALRGGFPNAEITLIGLPWARSFVQRFSRYLDRFVEFAGFPGIAECEGNPGRTARFLEEQHSYGYDLAIQMHGSGRTSNYVVCGLGAKMTAGYFEGDEEAERHIFAKERVPQGRPQGAPPHINLAPAPTMNGLLQKKDAHPDEEGGLTFAVPYPDDQPEVYRNIGLAKLLGCPADDLTLEFPLYESDYVEAAALLPPLQGVKRLRIGIHAGARMPARRWPTSYFASLADELVHLWDAQVILTGSTDELSTVHSVEEQMTVQSINLAGKTSLGGLAAIIDQLDLFISNDTGPAHIACALGVPSVIIFGPADYRRWAPLNQSLHRVVRHPVACSPCSFWECPIDHRCLQKVSPENVIREAGDLLAKGAVV